VVIEKIFLWKLPFRTWNLPFHTKIKISLKQFVETAFSHMETAFPNMEPPFQAKLPFIE
jgi:hypothetical protein